jgi:hypothetical protein
MERVKTTIGSTLHGRRKPGLMRELVELIRSLWLFYCLVREPTRDATVEQILERYSCDSFVSEVRFGASSQACPVLGGIENGRSKPSRTKYFEGYHGKGPKHEPVEVETGTLGSPNSRAPILQRVVCMYLRPWSMKGLSPHPGDNGASLAQS